MAVGYALGRRFLVLTDTGVSGTRHRLVIRRDHIHTMWECSDGCLVNGEPVDQTIDEILEAMEKDA